MNMNTETHPFVDVPLEKRPNYKEWRVTKDSIEIRVVNWFSLMKFVGAAHLYHRRRGSRSINGDDCIASYATPNLRRCERIFLRRPQR